MSFQSSMFLTPSNPDNSILPALKRKLMQACMLVLVACLQGFGEKPEQLIVTQPHAWLSSALAQAPPVSSSSVSVAIPLLKDVGFAICLAWICLRPSLIMLCQSYSIALYLCSWQDAASCYD